MLNSNAVKPTTEYQKNPNPQGKGVVPVLRDWATMQLGTSIVKAPDTLLRDYCISSLVLAANFGFKPVVGKTYFLYARESDWMMSLIAPHEWGAREPGAFLSCCRLRTDMTWEIDTDRERKADELALERAQAFVRGFVDALAEQGAIDQHLPFYVKELPYYQRLLATALAASLQRSMPASGVDVRALLGRAGQWLLSVEE
ncbi:Uncharacterised protein [Halioglobus japonicus]|nr:Uncharacterised protein [Halioglobus japonicus]